MDDAAASVADDNPRARLRGPDVSAASASTGRLTAGVIETPFGQLVVVADETGAVVRMDFAAPGDRTQLGSWRGLDVAWREAGALTHVGDQIRDYMAGERTVFDLALAPVGGGTFDREVWSALPALAPFGAITTYGEIARRLGRPGAARAVGHANATNPISLIVPCHRVVGADGRLVGYGGGSGVETKRALLDHEAKYRNLPPGLLV
jgi:methylated-DNA-[protein]-cysteine S-methyltransferase